MDDTLKPGNKSTITAYDWLETLASELRPSSFEDVVRKLDGDELRPDGKKRRSTC